MLRLRQGNGEGRPAKPRCGIPVGVGKNSRSAFPLGGVAAGYRTWRDVAAPADRRSPSSWCWCSAPAFGLALAGRHARQWLRDEMTSAQDSGRLETVRAVAEMPLSDQPARELARADRRLSTATATCRPGWSTAHGRGRWRTSQPGAQPSRRRTGSLTCCATDVAAGAAGRSRRGGAAWSCGRSTPNDIAAVWAEFLDLVLVLTLGRRRRRGAGVRGGGPGAAAAAGGRRGAAQDRRRRLRRPRAASRVRRSWCGWAAGSTRWPRAWPPCASATARSRSRS